MVSYIVRRLVLMLLVLWGLSIITFLITRVVPSDPAALYVGPLAKREQVANARVKLGLDKPIHLQYLYYVRDLLSGDLGESLRTHQPVLQDILRYLPASLELVLAAILLSLLVGIPLGALAAKWEGWLADHLSRLLAVAGVSLPGFWLGLLLQLLFFRTLNLLPLGGRLDTITTIISPLQEITGFYVLDALITQNWLALKDASLHLVLPALTLAAYPLGVVIRMTRSTMLEILQEDYIRTARATGFPERRILFTYTLRNALAPTITVMGLTFAYMLTGTFFVELIFYWPGLGSYTGQAILSNDYPVIMGVTLLVATCYVLTNLLVDILLVMLDPRIRLE